MRAIGSNGGLRLFARAVIFGLAAMLPKSAGAETIIYQGILNAGSAPFATLGSQPFPAGTKLVVTATFDTSSAKSMRVRRLHLHRDVDFIWLQHWNRTGNDAF